MLFNLILCCSINNNNVVYLYPFFYLTGSLLAEGETLISSVRYVWRVVFFSAIANWNSVMLYYCRLITVHPSFWAFIGIEKLRYMDLRAGCTTYTTPMDICVWCIHVCSSHICINISSFLCFLFFNNALWPYSCISIWNLFV